MSAEAKVADWLDRPCKRAICGSAHKGALVAPFSRTMALGAPPEMTQAMVFSEDWHAAIGGTLVGVSKTAAPSLWCTDSL